MRVPIGSSPAARRIVIAAGVAFAAMAMCYHPSHLPAQVSDAEYDVYRAFLRSHPATLPVVIGDSSDGGHVQLCVHLMKSDDTLLWELIRLEGKTFPLDAGRLGLSAAPPAGPHQRLKFTRVALAGETGVLQVSSAACDKSCGPERSEVFTTSKNGGSWSFRSPGCVQTRAVR
jgi:hypothetical protein